MAVAAKAGRKPPEKVCFALVGMNRETLALSENLRHEKVERGLHGRLFHKKRDVLHLSIAGSRSTVQTRLRDRSSRCGERITNVEVPFHPQVP
jgi:hypothetical protein